MNGEYMTEVQCNFQVSIVRSTADYCLVFKIIDDRCYSPSLWKPRKSYEYGMPCRWIKSKCKSDKRKKCNYKEIRIN